MLLSGKDWFVYALLEEDWVEIYVGVTNDPVARLKQHKASPAPQLRELMDQGYQPLMHAYRRFGTKAEALAFEAKEIRRLRPLLNIRSMPALDDEDCVQMVGRILQEVYGRTASKGS